MTFAPPRERGPTEAKIMKEISHEQHRFEELVREVGIPWIDADLFRQYIVCNATDPSVLKKLNDAFETQHDLQKEIVIAIGRRRAVINVIRGETCFGTQKRRAKCVERRFQESCVDADAQLEDDESTMTEDPTLPPTLKCSEASHRRMCSLLTQLDERTDEVILSILRWRSAFRRPLPFLINGENIIFRIQREIDSVVFPAQVHLIAQEPEIRSKPHFHISAYLAGVSALGRVMTENSGILIGDTTLSHHVTTQSLLNSVVFSPSDSSNAKLLHLQQQKQREKRDTLPPAFSDEALRTKTVTPSPEPLIFLTRTLSNASTTSPRRRPNQSKSSPTKHALSLGVATPALQRSTTSIVQNLSARPIITSQQQLAMTVRTELETQQNYLSEMILRCAQGKYVLVFNNDAFGVHFPLIPAPSFKGQDPLTVALRRDRLSPIHQRNRVLGMVTCGDEHQPEVARRRQHKLNAEVRAYQKRIEDERALRSPHRHTPLLDKLERRQLTKDSASSIGGSGHTSPRNGPSQSKAFRRLLAAQEMTRPMLLGPPDSNVGPTLLQRQTTVRKHTATKLLDVSHTSCKPRSTQRELPEREYQIVDDEGLCYFPDQDSLVWTTQCFHHAKKALDEYASLSVERLISSDGLKDESEDDDTLEAYFNQQSEAMLKSSTAQRQRAPRTTSPTQSNTGERPAYKGTVAQRLDALQRTRLMRSRFRSWMRFTMSRQQQTQVCKQLLEHTEFLERYARIVTWRKLIQVRKEKRRKAENLSNSISRSYEKEAYRRWRLAVTLSKLTRAINHRLYLKFFKAFEVPVLCKRAQKIRDTEPSPESPLSDNSALTVSSSTAAMAAVNVDCLDGYLDLTEKPAALYFVVRSAPRIGVPAARWVLTSTLLALPGLSPTKRQPSPPPQEHAQ